MRIQCAATTEMITARKKSQLWNVMKKFKIGTFRTNVGASPDLTRGKMNERQGRRHLCERKMQKSAAFQLEGKCNKATMKDQDESLKAFNQAGKITIAKIDHPQFEMGVCKR